VVTVVTRILPDRESLRKTTVPDTPSLVAVIVATPVVRMVTHAERAEEGHTFATLVSLLATPRRRRAACCPSRRLPRR